MDPIKKNGFSGLWWVSFHSFKEKERVLCIHTQKDNLAQAMLGSGLNYVELYLYWFTMNASRIETSYISRELEEEKLCALFHGKIFTLSYIWVRN